MTPNELLDSVCDRFTVLLLDEPKKLTSLLKLSLRRYQDKAGVVGTLIIDADAAKGKGVELPPFFLQLISVHDNTGAFQNALISSDGYINVDRPYGSYDCPPYRAKYVLDLSLLPLDNGVMPAESIGLIEQYLFHLIELQNNDRLRQANQAARLPVDHIPMAAETQAKIDALELAMEEEGTFLPTAYIAADYGFGGR